MNSHTQPNLSNQDEMPTYVLLSLQEQPYLEIKSGKNIYEYRTRYQKKQTTAFVYVSRTIKKIMAIIEFETPIIGTDKEISELSEKIKPGSYAGMMEYLKKGTGYAIPVLKMIEIEPVSLSELKNEFADFVVPQSYYLLNNKEKLLYYLLAKKHIHTIDFKPMCPNKPDHGFLKTLYKWLTRAC